MHGVDEDGIELPPVDLDIRVRRYGSLIRPRIMTYLTMVSGVRDVICHNASLHNALLAVSIRVLTAKVGKWFVPIERTRRPPGHSKILEPARVGILANLVECAPIPADQFAGLYCGLKRRVYEKAYESLLLEPLKKADASIRGFIKFEKILKKPEKPKAPRVISPPSTRYLHTTGCYIKPAEHVIYRAIDKMFGFKVVTKGLNYLQIGELFRSHWSEMADPVSFDVDVEKMDRSTSAEMLSWTHQFVTACFSDPREISKLLQQQLEVRTRIQCDDGHLSYTVDGTLTSGQMNTSLVGVTMISGCMFSLFHELGIPYRFVDAGDDCTVIVERRDAPKFLNSVRDFFRKVGFELTIGPQNDTLEGIDFCQTHPVRVGDKYTMVRNAVDAAIKDATSQRVLRTKRECAVWMKAVSLGGLATHGQVPVAQALYACYGRNADRMFEELALGVRQKRRNGVAIKRLMSESFSWNARQAPEMGAEYGSIDDYTRLSYFNAFGITPPLQVALEGYYDQLVIQYGPHAPWTQVAFNQLWS